MQKKVGFLNLLILLLSVYVLGALFVDTFYELDPETSQLLQILDWGICVIFFIDFLIQLSKAESKLIYMKWGWIDLLASIPMIDVLRVGRIFRMIRILRILKAFKSLKELLDALYGNRVKGTVTSAGLIAALMFIFSAISILQVEDDPESRPGSGRPVKAGMYAPDVMHSESLTFIEEIRNNPFFLYLPSQIPHASLEVPRDFLEIYLDDNGESIFEEEHIDQVYYVDNSMPKATYAAMVTYLDHQVGEILDKLKELGIAENTLVFFSSDNGSYSEGGYHYSMLNSNALFRGGKRDLYEGGIRVPTIAWWPGTVEARSVSDHISSFQDMMPTLSEVAGATPPPGIDGISMVPTLTGDGEQLNHEYLYWEFHEQGGKQAICKGAWKAVRLDVRENRNAPVELYNLADDISERDDIAGDHPEIVEEMKRLFEEAHIPSEIFPLFDED
jgi:hypothetical protein